MFVGKRMRGAQYMAGYAIECRLKAKLMEERNVQTLEDLEGIFSKKMRIHNLDELGVELSGWRRISRNKEFLTSWSVVRSWSVTWRYQSEFAQSDWSETEHFLDCVGKALIWLENSL